MTTVRSVRLSGPREFGLAVEVGLRRRADERIAAGRAKGGKAATDKRRETAEDDYRIARPWLEKANEKNPRLGRKLLAAAARKSVDDKAIKVKITVDRARRYLDEVSRGQ